jgi:hypothetical protein
MVEFASPQKEKLIRIDHRWDEQKWLSIRIVALTATL